MSSHTLAIPVRLAALLDAGLWPRNDREASAQNLRPLVSPDRVRLFAPEENTVYLQPPPFPTLAQEAGVPVKPFWSRFGALDQIKPECALIIGDFGLGSDAPIILDYRNAAAGPSVLRLRWSERGDQNQWIQCVATFEEFADLLGLSAVVGQSPDAADRGGQTFR